ncbi:MAG: ecdysteroid 22-kinase family protein [Paenibacillus sp.]|nr:ecdysteroid 22-kinase family protein [Paenibacillus sp.]
MTLKDNELLKILKAQGISDVSDIRRTEQFTRDRSTLNKIEILTKDNKIVSLLEKCTASNAVLHENSMYKYYLNKNVTIPKVFYNSYDQIEHQGILLMEDLTSTHNSLADWEVPIDPGKLTTLIDLISQFHAASWGKGELSTPKHLENSEEYVKHLSYLERDYLHFKNHQTFNFGEEQFKIYEKCLTYLRVNTHQHVERITSNQNTAFIHGDLNVCNIMYPLMSNSRPYIIDLEAVRVGLCTEDLVMLFIHDLYHGGEDTLRIFEMYYDSICSKISSEYTYDQFKEDTRLSIMEGIFFPLKLYTHYGVEDEELVWKSLNAYISLIGP